MDGRPTWTDCDEAGDYVVPNVLSPRDLVVRPDNMDETVPHTVVVVVVIGFYVSPTAKVIWRRDLGLKSHSKDWRSLGSNSRPLD